MAGAILVCLLYGTLLMLRGKIEFGNIYGFGICGCIAIYALINLLTKSQSQTVQLYSTICILGYCLLPFTVLALAGLFLDLLNPLGLAFQGFIVLWSAFAATRLFEVRYNKRDQRYLIMYPIALFYCVFVLLTVF